MEPLYADWSTIPQHQRKITRRHSAFGHPTGAEQLSWSAFSNFYKEANKWDYPVESDNNKSPEEKELEAQQLTLEEVRAEAHEELNFRVRAMRSGIECEMRDRLRQEVEKLSAEMDQKIANKEKEMQKEFERKMEAELRREAERVSAEMEQKMARKEEEIKNEFARRLEDGVRQKVEKLSAEMEQKMALKAQEMQREFERKMAVAENLMDRRHLSDLETMERSKYELIQQTAKEIESLRQIIRGSGKTRQPPSKNQLLQSIVWWI